MNTNTQSKGQLELGLEAPHVAWLKKAGACDAGIRYAAKFPTLREAWDACESADHMRWLVITIEEIKAGFDPTHEHECTEPRGYEDCGQCASCEQQALGDMWHFELVGWICEQIRLAYPFPEELP